MNGIFLLRVNTNQHDAVLKKKKKKKKEIKKKQETGTSGKGSWMGVSFQSSLWLYSGFVKQRGLGGVEKRER